MDKLKEKLTKEEVIKKSKELLEKFETTDMTAEEINNLNLEIKKNEEEIIKIKKDQERLNKKIAIRRNNVELLKGKIALKQLELNNIQFNKIEVEEPKTEENTNNNEN